MLAKTSDVQLTRHGAGLFLPAASVNSEDFFPLGDGASQYLAVAERPDDGSRGLESTDGQAMMFRRGATDQREGVG